MEQSPLLMSINNEFKKFDVEEILSNTLSKEEAIERLASHYWFERISRCGLTYGELDELKMYEER